MNQNNKRRPTTPGEILKEEFLLPMEITQKEFADHIQVDIKVINRVINGKTRVTPVMAVKLGSALGNSPQFWLNAQGAVDLFDARNELKVLPEPYVKRVS